MTKSEELLQAYNNFIKEATKSNAPIILDDKEEDKCATSEAPKVKTVSEERDEYLRNILSDWLELTNKELSNL